MKVDRDRGSHPTRPEPGFDRGDDPHLAYIVSRFPDEHETFILRELHAVRQILAATVPVFSLKPVVRRRLGVDTRELIQTTYYPTLGRLIRGLPVLLGSSTARACLREVSTAYRCRPLAWAKAVVTLILAAAIIPTVRRLRIHRIHAHWATMPTLAAYFIRRVAGIPYSFTAHAWDIYYENAMLTEKSAAAEVVVTCTSANRLALIELGVSPQKVAVCYHGLNFTDLPKPVFRRERGLQILAVGRLVEQKGFGSLIDACRILLDNQFAFRCRIIGAGPLDGELRRQIARSRLESQIAMLGNLPLRDVLAGYHWATVLCAPSVIAEGGDRDGIPNVLLEAMSQGLPVVASAVSGIPEIVRPARTGWLVRAGDARGLAETLLEIQKNPGEARRRAVSAYRLVRRHFDLNENVAGLLQVLVPSDASLPSPS